MTAANTVVLLQNVRLSFPALFKPRPKSRKTPDQLTFQATFLLPPSFDVKALERAAQAAVMAKFNKPVRVKSPIRDAGEKDFAGYEQGWKFISAWSNNRPAVVDRRAAPVVDEGLIYPGLWVNAHVNAFAWDHPEGGKGVSWNLNAIQIVRDDERLDGRVATGSVFAPLDEVETASTVSDDDTENPFL